MYKGYPNFSKARKIVQNYLNYSVSSWKKMFKDIHDTLKDYDEAIYEEDKINVVYEPSLINEGDKLKLNLPEKTSVEIFSFDINL